MTQLQRENVMLSIADQMMLIVVAEPIKIPTNRTLDENEIANVVVTTFNENADCDFEVIKTKVMQLISTGS